MNKKAFTVAELLISFMILGVVFALTLPTIICKDKRDLTIQNSRQKIYKEVVKSQKYNYDYIDLTE